MNDVAKELHEDCLQSVTPYSLVHAGNRSQGNAGTATPDTNLTVTATYGFRAVNMSVSSHGGIEGEQK
jgi:hypothetical protein